MVESIIFYCCFQINIGGDWLPYSDKVFEKLDMEKLPIDMPNLKKMMEEGVTFLNCITPSPLCAPARACLASGLRYENCGVVSNAEDYPVEQKTVPPR